MLLPFRLQYKSKKLRQDDRLLELQEPMNKCGLHDPQARSGNHIEHKVPPQQHPRHRRCRRPNKNPTDHPITDPNGKRGQIEEESDEEYSGGMATGKRPVVDGDDEGHVLVVNGAGAADGELDRADDGEVEEGTKKEGEEKGEVERGGEGEEGDGDREPEAAVAGDF